MSYLDRQHEFKIVFPDKKEYFPLVKNFQELFNHFLESKDSVGKTKTTNLNDNGVSMRKVPLSVEFSGDDHDSEARAFQASAAYTGEVFLQLAYGNEIRCHTNTVAMSYSIVNDIATTRFDLEFVECTGKTTPIGGRSQLAAILEKSDSVNDDAASTFAGLKINNQKELTGITGVFTSAVDSVNLLLRPLLNGEAEAITIFDATYNDIISNVSELATDAVTLARQTATLIALPAKFNKKANAIIDGYKNMIASILPATGSTEKNNDGKNQSINAAFFGGSGVASLAGGVVAADYQTTPEAIKSVEDFQETYDIYRDAMDDLQDEFNDPTVPIANRFVQDGTLDVPLNDLSQDASGSILSVAFDLKKEFIIILDQETTAINLAIEYYPDQFIDDEITTLDFVINSNNLIGDELILIPRGREIVVYV